MNGDGKSLVHLEGVWRTYGGGELKVEALKDVSLDVPAEEFTVVLGPSGSGKTTLLNLIGGIDRPTSGRVLVGARDISSMTEKELNAFRRQSVGFIFQFFNLVPSLTAAENVELAAELVDQPRDVDEVLKEVGLEGRRDHFPDQLSGGEQQRVAIARALVKNPSILLCDEPTGELDYQTGRKVLANMRDINRQEGRSFILVTHNSAIAGMADRVLRLSAGEIVEDRRNPSPTPPQELRW
jgi:putative ABC transport system ATP-binding protein